MNALSKLKIFSTLLNPESRYFPLINLIAGALLTLAFAPFHQIWLVFLLPAVLFYGWSVSTPKQALLNGWLFSVGLQCSGVSWIFYSLHYHGGSPSILAVLMIFLLAAYLSIYPALAGFLINRYCKVSAVIKLMVLYPVAWALFEWLQGIVMTGFAWMQLGYTQIDLPLAGYAPVLGNHGVGLFVAATSGLIVLMVTRPAVWKKWLVTVAAFWIIGFILKQVAWTEPVGEAVRVSLVQGNIPQSIKWKREMRQPTLMRYRNLSLQQKDTDLIIWPETALPGYQHNLPVYLDNLRETMKERNVDLLTGIFIKDMKKGRYYNSLINIHGGEYRKRHLVPLGEYIPLRFLASFFNRWIKIPMSDIDVGDDSQPLLRAAGQPLGVSICFEDAFARDVRKDLPEATLLVNVSNDAWFEDSHELYQHHEIARMRALESGRYMLRSTNTGISSIIGPHGEVVALAPHFKIHVLNATVQPMKGATPYIFWGDYFLLLTGISVIGWFVFRSRGN
jgi:apolipoprotein N-acyltransferase